mgnify:CR=1 FL=1
MFEAVGAYSAGRIDADELDEFERKTCPTCGSLTRPVHPEDFCFLGTFLSPWWQMLQDVLTDSGIETVTARNWISDGIGFAKCAGYGPLAFYNNSHGLYFDSGPNHGYIYDNVIERVSGMGIQMNHTRR